MNKIFTKIATACAGLAMAIGVGVAIGNNANVVPASATTQSESFDYSAIKTNGMLSGDYADASSYWKVPSEAGKTATITINLGSSFTPTSNIVMTFKIATFGSGTNPSSTNTTVTTKGYSDSTATDWTANSALSSYPSSSTYVSATQTVTKPQNPVAINKIVTTFSVNSKIKILRLQEVAYSFDYSGGTVSTKLGTPELAYSNGQVTWGAISNAASYDVSVDDATAVSVNSQTTSYDVSGLSRPAIHTISVTAVASGQEYVSSDAGEITFALTNHHGTAEDPYNVADARLVIDSGKGLTDVYVTGTVSKIVTAYNSQYGNISYNISDDGLTTSNQLQAFRGKGVSGANFTSEDDIQVDDVVVVYGTLTKYNSTYELAEGNQLVTLTRIGAKTILANSVTIANGNVNLGTVAAGHTVTFTATVNYQQGNDYKDGNGEVTWSSSDEGVATINSTTGVASVVGAGNTTITATSKDGGNVTGTVTLTIGGVTLPRQFTVKATDIEGNMGYTTAGLTATYSGLDNLSGSSTSVTITENNCLKNNDDFQVNSGKGSAVFNSTAIPGRILTITATFTAKGKNTTKMYGSYGEEATASSTLVADGSSNTTEQVFDFTAANYNYFFFDCSTVTGACYFQLTIEFGEPLPQVTADPSSATIYTSNNGGAATSFVSNLTYTRFDNVEDVTVSSDDTNVIPNANCVLANDFSKLTVSSNGVPGSAKLTIEAMDSDTEVYTCTISVTVVNNSISVSSIAVTAQPTKTTYTEGEGLDVDGIVITATYSNSSTDDVTSECTFTPANGSALSLSDTTVTVSYTYAGKTVSTTFSLTINEKPKYTLVTDVTQLTEGSKVLIAGVKNDKTYVAKSFTTGNNLSTVEASFDANGKLLKSAEMSAMTLEATKDGYTMKDEGNSYLYAASSGSNHLKGQESPTVNAYWSIEINDGSFSVVAHKSSNRNVMQFNSSSLIVSCYASASQQPVKLYVLDETPSEDDKVLTFSNLYMHKKDIEHNPLDEDSGSCKGEEGYFAAARAALTGSWASIAEAFSKSGDMWDRYVAWGAACGVEVTFNNGIQYSGISTFGGFTVESNNEMVTIIVVMSALATICAGGFFFYRRRKEQQ